MMGSALSLIRASGWYPLGLWMEGAGRAKKSLCKGTVSKAQEQGLMPIILIRTQPRCWVCATTGDNVPIGGNSVRPLSLGD